MRTHLDIGLMTARLQAGSRRAIASAFLEMYRSRTTKYLKSPTSCNQFNERCLSPKTGRKNFKSNFTLQDRIIRTSNAFYISPKNISEL